MLLDVRNLRSSFFLDEGELKAVDDVSFTIDRGESVALVGESGCGKTIVALSLLDLIASPGRVVSGEVLFEGEDLQQVSRERLRQVRGGGIGMVFQEPAAALNPVYTIGSQLVDVLLLHQRLSKDDARGEAVGLLGDVGLPQPERWFKAYPFELSGGMQQRALIAIAIAGRPKLLIADEPTTALDPTVQAEILGLLTSLRDELGLALLLITHDVGAVEVMADRVMVMYAGKLVEVGAQTSVFGLPTHPYTRGLLASVPRLGAGRDTPLKGIPGAVPDLLALPSGCAFHPRCPLAEDRCSDVVPGMMDLGRNWRAACHKVSDVVAS